VCVRERDGERVESTVRLLKLGDQDFAEVDGVCCVLCACVLRCH